MKPHYELIIIGGGPAGLTAAVYAARRKLDTLVVAKDIGGQAAWSADIENYLGFNVISGPELVEKFYQHVKRIDDDNAQFDLEVVTGVEVTAMQRSGDDWWLTLSDGQSTSAVAVIVAAGKVPRLLKIPGEQALIGHGVTFCATCDAPLYRGKTVAVVGGGNSALDAALQLMRICPRVYLVTVNEALQGEQVMIDHVTHAPNVTVLTERETVAVEGGNVVTGLRLRHRRAKQEELVKVDGVFEEIGYEPASSFLQGMVAMNDYHEIVVDAHCCTSAPGIFAAGDITTVPQKQIIVAAGEGAKAALEAHSFVMQRLGRTEA